MKKLTLTEGLKLNDILTAFEEIELVRTGVKDISGGFTKATLADYDKDSVEIDFKWGTQGDSTNIHVERYILKREVLLKDISISEKVAEIHYCY